VADLDAIDRRLPTNADLHALASVGAPVWLDAGITSVSDARRALSCGASRLIVGLETLPSFEVLESICQSAGGRVVFSLDLRDGMPVTPARGVRQASPEELAVRAAAAGAGAVIVLDLARVGSGSGIDLEMLARIRSSVLTVPVYAGGGVRNVEDIRQVQRAGCAGVLVASALLDGLITKHDLDLCLVPAPST